MKADHPNQLLSRWLLLRRVQFMIALLLFISTAWILSYHDFLGMIGFWSVMTIGISLFYWIHRRSNPGYDEVIKLSNEQNHQLEYSASLLLDSTPSNGLAQIQINKIKSKFGNFDYKIPLNYIEIRRYCFLAASLIIGMMAVEMLVEGPDSNRAVLTIDPVTEGSLETSIQNDTTYIESVDVTIHPPGYTELKRKRTKDLSIQVNEGASVTWDIGIKGQAEKLFFVFSGKDSVYLNQSLNYRKKFTASDIYNYGYLSRSNTFVSDYFSINVIADEHPVIEISGIEEFVKLPWGKSHQVTFGIKISDDFKLTEGFISATVAKGSGEAVKFRERKYELVNFSNNSTGYQGAFTFSTNELNMEPGDELYFFVAARDNCPFENQWSRSATHFISIEDTSTVEFVYTDGLNVDLMPDFFRSQRQIIHDSEQLLKDKVIISVDSFRKASNALGFDQKMLRLKYGQFLGEENESGISIDNEPEEDNVDDLIEDGHDDHSDALEGARAVLDQFKHDHDHEEEENLLLSTRGTERSKDPSRPTWVEELSHNHDDTEVATFHSISIKAKLKAALSIMWDAELHLRLYDPLKSLPYQYESLAYLQEVKNHARIYVQRIGFDPPAIKENESRLEGNQQGILSISEGYILKNKDDFKAVKEMIRILGDVSNENIDSLLFLVKDVLVMQAVKNNEMIPVLSTLRSIEEADIAERPRKLKLFRKQLLQILPAERRKVNNNFNTSHQLTRTVVKKMNS